MNDQQPSDDPSYVSAVIEALARARGGVVSSHAVPPVHEAEEEPESLAAELTRLEIEFEAHMERAGVVAEAEIRAAREELRAMGHDPDEVLR